MVAEAVAEAEAEAVGGGDGAQGSVEVMMDGREDTLPMAS